MFFSKLAVFTALAASFVAAEPAELDARSDTYTITVYNQCPYTVWPAAQQTDFVETVKIDSQYTGTTLASGKKWTMTVPTQAMGLRVWARTGCNADATTCDVGTCTGGLLCTQPMLTSSMTVAEFGYSSYLSGMIFYDLSLIQGNTMGMQITPSDTTCETKKCLTSGCALSEAWHSASDAASGSPADTGCKLPATYTLTFCPS